MKYIPWMLATKHHSISFKEDEENCNFAVLPENPKIYRTYWSGTKGMQLQIETISVLEHLPATPFLHIFRTLNIFFANRNSRMGLYYWLISITLFITIVFRSICIYSVPLENVPPKYPKWKMCFKGWFLHQK